MHAFQLYEKIVKPNELGLSLEVYEIFMNVILPNMKHEGTSDQKHIKRATILSSYFEKYKRNLSYKRLDKQLIPSLIGAGLVHEEYDAYACISMIAVVGKKRKKRKK